MFIFVVLVPCCIIKHVFQLDMVNLTSTAWSELGTAQPRPVFKISFFLVFCQLALMAGEKIFPFIGQANLEKVRTILVVGR